MLQELHRICFYQQQSPFRHVGAKCNLGGCFFSLRMLDTPRITTMQTFATFLPGSKEYILSYRLNFADVGFVNNYWESAHRYLIPTAGLNSFEAPSELINPGKLANYIKKIGCVIPFGFWLFTHIHSHLYANPFILWLI